MPDNFTIINNTNYPAPTHRGGVSFQDLKNEVLGQDYNLELIFLSAQEIQRLNQDYRSKNTPTNILSFPLSSKQGQIFICPSLAKKEAPRFNRAFDNYLVFLFIHGLMHLKGFDHGSKMENEEQKIQRRFNV